MTDPQENPMILEGQMAMHQLEGAREEEEREVRPEKCGDCKWVTEDYAHTGDWLYCEHESLRIPRALPPSLKGKPPDWCPWEEE